MLSLLLASPTFILIYVSYFHGQLFSSPGLIEEYLCKGELAPHPWNGMYTLRQGETNMAQDTSFSTPFTRRRFLQYTGSAALGSSLLAACAGTGSGGGSPSNSSSVPTLQQWYHQYGEEGTHDAVLKYAKGYTKANVKVSWVPGTGNEYPDKTRAAL